MIVPKRLTLLLSAVALVACTMDMPSEPVAEERLSTADARAIAREVYIYGNPLVDSYRILHTYFVDESSPEYKASWNEVRNLARVFTHEDTAVQTANSDTPYSFAGIDLRSEPVVLTAPPMEDSRYFSIQLIDLYTHIVDYIGTRTTGNGGGNFLLTGPGWQGDVPLGIDKVISIETQLLIAIYRTQLFNPDDLENVKQIQAGYLLRPLSDFAGTAAPEPAPAIDFIEPLSPEAIRTSVDVFDQVNFILQFCPTHPSETELMARFARTGVGAGLNFDATALDSELRQALEAGIADAWQVFNDLRARADRGEVSSGDVFGSRDHLQDNYLYPYGQNLHSATRARPFEHYILRTTSMLTAI